MAFRPTSGGAGKGFGKLAGSRKLKAPQPAAAPAPKAARKPREPGTRPDVGPPRVTNYAKDPTDYGVQDYSKPLDFGGDD